MLTLHIGEAVRRYSMSARVLGILRVGRHRGNTLAAFWEHGMRPQAEGRVDYWGYVRGQPLLWSKLEALSISLISKGNMHQYANLLRVVEQRLTPPTG